MKIKIVESLTTYNQELQEKINQGTLKQPEAGIVMTPETFAKVFSPERIKLLQRIHKNNLKNIYQLAKELHKPYEVVFRNIKYLDGIGLIKVSDKEDKKIPHLDEKLVIDFFSQFAKA